MSQESEKFQELLRELFQFDCADLDFGVYRVMNYKRDVIEDFITTELPERVNQELESGTLGAAAGLMREVEAKREEIRTTLGADAMNGDDNLSDAYKQAPIGQQYLMLSEQIERYKQGTGLEATIYSHLYRFFRRYYQDGDFISKRRYSKRQKYAIPYNGEEVYLHWANADQYYVKTGEFFNDYSFVSDGVTVHFKITGANVEQNNVKGDKRFFLARVKETEWDEGARALTVPFEYRPLTEQEEIAYGKRNQQDAIIAEIVETLTMQVKDNTAALAALTAERRKNAAGESVSYLEHHLRQYTRRNTSDFFIHKDLEGFLSRELDFYLKNEVLDLDELEAAGEERAEGWFQMMRVIKAIGRQIIDFLEQLESFQKMLWEKRKFVTEVQYLITVGTIDESFYPAIAECEAQWEEWKELFHIDEEKEDLFTNGKNSKEKRIAFLREHRTLPVNTAVQDRSLADSLLGKIKDIEESYAGSLFHSENYQALSLLMRKLCRACKCIYIDPPYNSKTTEILYKNSYRHSSWLCLMDSRLQMSRHLASADGSHVVAIDENEQELLGQLLNRHFPDYEKVCVTVVHNKKGIQGDYFSYNHDFAFFCIPKSLPETKGRPVPEEEWDYVNLRKWGRESERDTAKNCFYPVCVENGEIVGFGDVCAEDYHPPTSNVRQGNVVEVYPVDSQGVERKWRYARQSVEKIKHLLKVHTTRNGEVQILKANDQRAFKTVWDDAKYIAGDYGTKWLTDLGLKVEEDLYPKSIHAVLDSIHAVADDEATVLDYFAGSGTTGHAVINLNREDGGRRKFILVEMGEYFDTVLLPRIKKVTFAPEWKEGKPKRMATKEEAERSPRIVKYLRLESYEDALNNIQFDDASGQGALEFDDYLLKYMLKWETRGSETLLNVKKLTKPFDYKLRIYRDGEIKEQRVDIPETFNYLIGLHVKTRRVYEDDGRRYLVYRGRVDHREVVVIWRDTEGWGKAELERDKAFVREQKLTEGADEVFVNGDSFIPKAKALEPVFKARMFAPMETGT